MRSFYIFLNIFLFIMAVLLLAVNISFKPYPPDKILSMAPVLNETVQSGQKIKGGKEEISEIASLWENNLFSPYRSGEGGPLLGAARPTGMELLGVCSFGEVSGAIIVDKQTSAAAVPQPGRLRNRGGASSGAASATMPRFYKLGEQLENGFTLSEINFDSIVLSRGREQIVLKLEFEGESSISRNAAAAEAAVAAAASAAIKIEQKPPQNVQTETPESTEVPAAPGEKAVPGTPTPASAPAVSGAPAAPGVIAVPSVRTRVQPPLSRRQRPPPETVNPE